MSLKVKRGSEGNFQRFKRLWKRWDARAGHELRDGDTKSIRDMMYAAFEAGWACGGGGPHRDPKLCKHENVVGIAVVLRPCPNCGTLLF